MINELETQRQRLQARKIDLQRKLNAAMQGRVILTPKGAELKQRLAETDTELKEIEAKQLDNLNLRKAPYDNILELVAIPLLADVMNDLTAGIDSMLRRNGCTESIFAEKTRKIKQLSYSLMDCLANSEQPMVRVLDADDTLVDAIKKKLMTYIKRHLTEKG